MNSALLPPPPLVGAFDWPPFLDGPVSPHLSYGHVDSALRTPPNLLPSITEVALPSPWLPPRHPASAVVLLRSHLSNRSSRSPGSDVFFYSSHPSIFPASFISSMDSLQSFICHGVTFWSLLLVLCFCLPF
ncbi:hypothetical protein AMECASPLE_020015 [Ameca splendens]|uniref:Uncharacterized protein n=1 Tax=Ameca splendens TaxID=208324 RepID=A0ABV1A014_9TELE